MVAKGEQICGQDEDHPARVLGALSFCRAEKARTCCGSVGSGSDGRFLAIREKSSWQATTTISRVSKFLIGTYT
jgi:hypothetical protein